MERGTLLLKNHLLSPAAEGAGHRAGRVGGAGRGLRPPYRLSHPVSMDAARRHQRHRGRAEGIARLLAGKYAVMNLIPYNSVEGVDGFDYRRPSWERAAEMARRLHVRGISPSCATRRDRTREGVLRAARAGAGRGARGS